MGLFQNLLETYENCAEAVGKEQIDADGKVNEKKTLLPICHMTFKSEICVTIDKDGHFISASRDGKETTIVIPCTESSAGRSSGIAAHPLCDQLDYVGGINDDKTNAYLSGLNAWKDAIAELDAIHTYVSEKTIINDLLHNGIFKDSEFQSTNEENAERHLDREKIRKIGVRFTVLLDDDAVNVWQSETLRSAWISHVIGSTVGDNSIFDYLSGEIARSIAAQHPKNINSFTGNAKLLSCNDTTEFTFRGRFAEKDDALIIDYAQSQKMHQMLRWLIANYGYAVDSQVVVTWAVDRDTQVKAKAQENSFQLYSDMETVKTDADILSEAKLQVDANYAEKLKKLLQGYGNAEDLKQHHLKICIAVFDAATTGRMGLVFYQEMPKHQYHENIVNWHLETSYYLTAWKKEKDENGKEKSIPIHYVGAPSYDDILFAVYGKSRGDKSYDTLKKKTRKQLLECMFGNFAFPKSMVDMAANRASQPMSFTDSNGKFSENDWRRAISITCALARKFYKSKSKEVFPLTLDELQNDRSYLYGRWLAVADKIEEAVLRSQDKQNERPTNAVRLTSSYSVKPFTTKLILSQQLQPYIMQKNSLYKNFFLPIITEIDEKLMEYTDNNDHLSPLYLLGYSAQYRALSKNNKIEKSEGTDNDSTAK